MQAISVLCLAFGVWLAVQDTTWIWAAGAGTAVGVVAVSSLSGFGTVELWGNSLGTILTWANVVAVSSAALIVVLAGAAPMPRQRATGATTDT